MNTGGSDFPQRPVFMDSGFRRNDDFEADRREVPVEVKKELDR
jgi:hypothetical protein